MNIFRRIYRIIRGRCTQCGNNCEKIGSFSSKGFIKEWCDNCAQRILGKLVPLCQTCTDEWRLFDE